MKVLIVLLLLVTGASAQTNPPKQKVIDTKFIIINTMQFASAAIDIEGTQQCISSGSCHEANPMVPSSRSGAYAVNLSIAGVATLSAYFLKKTGKAWWASPISNTAGHVVGAISGWTK